MRQLLVKSGIKQLKLFEGEDFPCFEAYLGSSDRLEDLLNTRMQLKVIHMPHAVNDRGRNVVVNFCGDQTVREASLQKLQEIIHFAQAHQVPCIVLHAGFFDSRTQNKKEQIDIVVEGLSSLDSGNVALCVENVPRWVNLSFESEPVIADEEDFDYLKSRWPQCGFTCDVEHAALNAVFQEFYARFQNKAPAEITFEFRRSMEEEICQDVARDPLFFQARVDQAIERLLKAVEPRVVHAMGSDFCNYRGFDRLPLTGEAIPLAYQGLIGGIPVRDRINHAQWIGFLPEKVFITLEFMIRLDYNYIDQNRLNRAYLEDLFKVLNR